MPGGRFCIDRHGTAALAHHHSVGEAERPERVADGEERLGGDVLFRLPRNKLRHVGHVFLTPHAGRQVVTSGSADGAVLAKGRRGGNAVQRGQAPVAPVLIHDRDLMRQRCVDFLDAIVLSLHQIGSGRLVRRHDQRGGRHHVRDRPTSRLIVDHFDDLAAIVQTAGRAEDAAQVRYGPLRTMLLDLEARPLVAGLRLRALDFALDRCLACLPVVRLDLLRREVIEVDFGKAGLHPADVVLIVLIFAGVGGCSFRRVDESVRRCALAPVCSVHGHAQ
jgi:hypothetical protein